MTKNATYCDKHVSSRKCIFFCSEISLPDPDSQHSVITLDVSNMIPTVWRDAKHPPPPRYLSPLNPSSITCPMHFKYTNQSLLPVMQLAKTRSTMFLLDLTASPTKILD